MSDFPTVAFMPLAALISQKRFSYTTNDIEWNHMFVPMVSEGPEGECVIDFTRLHTTVPMTLEDEEDMAPVVSIQ